MWLITRTGFYSINKPGSTPANCLQLRARRREDLEEMCRGFLKLNWPAFNIAETASYDYPFRATVPSFQFVEWLIDEVRKIDYSNFKDTVKQKDRGRAAIYDEVWAALRGLAE